MGRRAPFGYSEVRIFYLGLIILNLIVGTFFLFSGEVRHPPQPPFPAPQVPSQRPPTYRSDSAPLAPNVAQSLAQSRKPYLTCQSREGEPQRGKALH